MPGKVLEIVGERELRLKLEGTAKALASNKVLMGQIGTYIEDQILFRTAEGKDVDENMFIPYSPLYAAFRSKKGRPVDKVDLNFRGSMLAALTHSASKDKVVVFFMPTVDREGVSDPEKAYYNQQLRDFFGMSAKDVTEIEDMVNSYVQRHLDKKG
jgi:hypothetical protein